MRRFFYMSSLLSLCILSGFSSKPSLPASSPILNNRAIAVIFPTQGNTTQGVVEFSSVKDGVKVTAKISGLTPGKHGFHIHEFGDMSSANGSAAGSHFNPGHHQHGGRNNSERHGGDLGNLEADQSGVATLDYVDSHLQLEGPNSIIGRGLIIHEKEDDFTTQPTGGAGARIGQGVIGRAQGMTPQ